MPSESSVLPLQTEKPQHYTYLKEFRTQQCPLFLQHKCTQHRPFTCFHWHFLNQKRRRPVRKRDGTFSYSPDVYCTNYDENVGNCPHGEDCPLLHRTAGDTERRYHLRYYKTGTCVHETDARGHCVKNGPHCAFAHGAHDLRPPVYDAREMALMEQAEKSGDSQLPMSPISPNSLEKDKLLTEDPRWNDTNFVLQNYKTEQCKRPPRLCRQGYACPCYHNNRDRRRSPKKLKYRSTPCPNVKHGDDWGDPSLCDQGDNCPYCHTRTEQQFHPEIYKSTKCNDMVQSGYCPRGPFCAFAHVEQEMIGQRDVAGIMNNSLGAFLPNSLQQGDGINDVRKVLDELELMSKESNNNSKSPGAIGKERSSSTSTVNNIMGNNGLPTNMTGSFTQTSMPEPIGKGRSSSTSSSISDVSSAGLYQRATGMDRDDSQINLRQQLQAIDDDGAIDLLEKVKRKQNLMILNNFNSAINGRPTSSISPSSSSTILSSIASTIQSTISSTMSPLAVPFFPPGDTVNSVIASTLDDSDLNLNFDLATIDMELDNDTNSVSSSLSAGFSSSAGFNSHAAASIPIAIPSNSDVKSGVVGNLSQSPTSSMGSLPPTFVPQALQMQQKQEQQLEQAQAAFLSQPNPGRYAVPGFADFPNNSTRNSTSGSQSPLTPSSTLSNSNNSQGGDMYKLQTELSASKAKLASWEEAIAQARSACEAWKKEAEESIRKAKVAEETKAQAMRLRDEAITQVTKLKQDNDRLNGGSFLRCLHKVSELDSLPLGQLKQIQQQLRLDLDRVDKIVYQYTAMKCLVCQDKNRSVAVMPCNHYVLCDLCATTRKECPYCHSPITQRSSLVLPL